MKPKPEHIKQADWDAVDSPPLSDKLLSRMRPVRETHPDIPSRVRGPRHVPPEIPVSIRLSPVVVEYFQFQGKGWQTKINDILREYVETHQIA